MTEMRRRDRGHSAGDPLARPAAKARPSRPHAPAYVHITGLPETAYERLVGRDAELKRLDDAWADAKTNILSLIAEGGAGKSALVNEWLKRMQADSYRGAEAVLGWSFYSQGIEGARDLGGGIPQLGAGQARLNARHHQRDRQGRGDRRGAGEAPRAARARRRRAAAARPRQAAGRAEGSGPARAAAALRGDAAGRGARARRAHQPAAGQGHRALEGRRGAGRRCRRGCRTKPARRCCATTACGARTASLRPRRAISAAIRSRSACSRASSRRRRTATCAGAITSAPSSPIPRTRATTTPGA